MNAGALQPCAVRQVTTPRPCSPPTMNAAFAMFGTTAIHLASFSTSSGMLLSGAVMISFMTVPAACRRRAVSCCPEPANAKGTKDNVNKAIAYFFIKKLSFFFHAIRGRRVRVRLLNDHAVRRPLIRLMTRDGPHDVLSLILRICRRPTLFEGAPAWRASCDQAPDCLQQIVRARTLGIEAVRHDSRRNGRPLMIGAHGDDWNRWG